MVRIEIPDDVRKCVGFLVYKNATKFLFGGTCFFVGVQKTNNNPEHPAIVTAKHVIDEIRKDSVDGMVYFRFNLRDGHARIGKGAPLEHWEVHPTDPSVDVAALQASPTADTDHLTFSAEDFATEGLVKKEGIGLGEEVFLVGLFSEHFGSKRNIPIVRIGNIAAMPEEPVSVPGLGSIDAYLIEARSIGGLSGSPVFVNLGKVRVHEGQLKYLRNGLGFYLLGLMLGHWDRKVPVAAQDEDHFESVNMGIGIVVPAGKILEVIDQPGFVERGVRWGKERADALRK